MLTLLTPRRAAWLLGGYACAVLVVVFEPIPHLADGSVNVVDRVVRLVGLQGWMTPTAVEFGWNVVLFVPLTFLGSMIVRRLSWQQWAGIGVLTSATIELVQLLALPGRSASLLDLTSNSLGGLAGALLARALRRRQEHREATMGYAEAGDNRPDEE